MRGASGCVLGSGCYVSPAAADHGTSPSGPGWLATAPRSRRRPARSCVYVSAAKSWWEIGKNDPACLYLTVYCPPAARRAAVCSRAEKIQLETKVIRMFPKISQSRRRPLLGPYPG